MPQSVRSSGGTASRASANAASDDYNNNGDDEAQFLPVTTLRDQYLDYLMLKVDEYNEQKEARHYYHCAQWDAASAKILRDRKQPIITFPRIHRKIDSIVGLVGRLRQDPKAYPRNPRNADGAEIATQCVRAVLEAGDFEFVDPYCAGQAGIEGIAGIELKLVDGDHNDPDITFDFIFGDDFFYTPTSARPDFSDAPYMGLGKWIGIEAAVELFPDQEEDLRSLMTDGGSDLTTNADREFKWVNTTEKRIRLVEHWYRHKGKWCWAFYCSTMLLDQGVSEFLDERGNTMNRFIMFSANVDHDGDRYGFVRALKGAQDELNQRRSKALFMSNAVQVTMEKGTVDNVEIARREFARADGLVETNPGKPAPVVNAAKGQDVAQQLTLMQDARAEIDSFAQINPDALRADDASDHSGVAINLIQRAAQAELGSFLRNYKSWKKRVYRAVWNMVVRTWQSERFIRVTDNQGIAKFFQVNKEDIDPATGESLLINAVGSMNVEMSIDDGPNEANLMQDAYDVLKGYPPGTIPPQVLIELSPLSSQVKQRVLSLLSQPPDPMTIAAKQMALQGQAADIDHKKADTASKIADVENKRAQAQERRTRSVTDIARAAHLGHQANLDTAEFLRSGVQAQQSTMGAQPQPQQPDNMAPPQGAGPQPGMGRPAPMQVPSWVPNQPPPSQVFGRFSAPPQ